eukprot:COSAG02_NODE_2790_length_8022_cov_52.613783_4_plen_69_part_00
MLTAWSCADIADIPKQRQNKNLRHLQLGGAWFLERCTRTILQDVIAALLPGCGAWCLFAYATKCHHHA